MTIFTAPFYLVVWLSCILAVSACSTEPPPDTSEAQSYSVVKTYMDGHVGFRRQLQIDITSEASNRTELAHTAMKAALESGNEAEADVVAVRLYPTSTVVNGGWDLARATYAKDGRGYNGMDKWSWEITVVDTYPSQRELEIIELWEANCDRFCTTADEARLRAFIAESLNIPVEEVDLPLWQLHEFPIKAADNDRQVDSPPKPPQSRPQADTWRLEPEPRPTDAGRRFLNSKLSELDSFKSDPKFHQFGFVIGGPFNSWLKSVQSNRDASNFSFLERVAVGNLQMLGLEYMNTKGREDDYTRFERERIGEVIRAPGGS